MLPSGERDKSTALQVILYTIWTILISIIPVFGVTGTLQLSVVSAVIVGVLGLGMLYYAIRLYIYQNNVTAKRLMLSSVSYITLIQLIYVADKFLR